MLNQRHLIVLDDESAFCEVVAKVAEGIGYKTTKLNDPRRFEETYSRIRPDVVVIDMIMPDRDGLEIVQWLTGVSDKVRVLLVSGYDPMYTHAATTLMKAKGFVDIHSLSKPLNLTALREILDSE